MDPMLVECVSVRPFKLLARSPPTSTRRRDMEGEQRNGGGGERERGNNNQMLLPLVSSRIRRVPGTGREPFAEIFTTNFGATIREGQTVRAGERSINDRASRREEEGGEVVREERQGWHCHVGTRDDFKVHSHESATLGKHHLVGMTATVTAHTLTS